MKRLLPLLLILAACSSETAPSPATTAASQPSTPPPTVAEARAMIAESAELGHYEFTNAAVSIPVSGASMSEPTRALAKDLSQAKWIALDGAGNVLLTDRSRNDRRFLLRANGILDIVPLAKKEMGEVTEVRANADGTAAADFTWRWIANEVGSAIRSGPVHDRYAAAHQARATLIWDGTTWSVLGIEGR